MVSLFKNNIINNSRKLKNTGLKSQSNIMCFTTVADSGIGHMVDTTDTVTRKVILRNLRDYLLSKTMHRESTGSVLTQRARNSVGFILASGLARSSKSAQIREMMRTAKHGNGWFWDRVTTLPHTGTISDLRSLRSGYISAHDSVRTQYAHRSLVSRGLHNNYVALRVPGKARIAAEKLRATNLQYNTTFYKLLRMRFERWFFKCLGSRTYIWFSNIWKDVTSRVNGKVMEHMYTTCMQKLAKKGSQFFMEPQQAHIVFQSIFLAVASITGLQFFMKMMSTMISMFRSHWQLVKHLMGLFYRCKNYFWFKSLYNYRIVMRGKFGGHLRARQEVFQHGVVKIHQWDQNVNYYRIFPVTIYGVFSVRFWLQMRDMRILRLAEATRDIVRYAKEKKPRARRSRDRSANVKLKV